MKRFIILVVVLATLGGVAWGIGAMVTHTAATRWVEARAADGWVANTAAISVGGFPFAFQTRFIGLDLADPTSGLAWSAPDFTLQQDVFRLDRMTATWPDTQTIASPEERFSIASTAMTAGLDVQPTARFSLDAMQAVLSDVTIRSSDDWYMALEEARLDVLRLGNADAIYDVDFEATALVPTQTLRNRLDPAGLLPEAMDRATARVRLAFDAPWDMDALEVARPQITAIEIDEINAIWGNLLLRASGDLTVTPEGFPEGDLAVRAENWRDMVDLAENSGLLLPGLRPTVEAMLGALAGMNGRAEDIDATLSFSDGRVFFGMLPLGPAPYLRLR